MLKLLGITWTVWSLLRKRVGPVRGLVLSILVAGSYVLVTNWLEENHPELATLVE